MASYFKRDIENDQKKSEAAEKDARVMFETVKEPLTQYVSGVLENTRDLLASFDSFRQKCESVNFEADKIKQVLDHKVGGANAVAVALNILVTGDLKLSNLGSKLQNGELTEREVENQTALEAGVVHAFYTKEVKGASALLNTLLAEMVKLEEKVNKITIPEPKKKEEEKVDKND